MFLCRVLSGLYPYRLTDLGSYVFPFSFALMPNLPGSIQIAGSNAGLPYFGSVRYKVKATVDLQGFFARDLKYTHDLIIHEPLHYQIASVWNEKSGTARFLCCIPKGMSPSLTGRTQADAFPSQDGGAV